MRTKWDAWMFFAATAALLYAAHNMTNRRYEIHDTNASVIRLDRATGKAELLRLGDKPHWEVIADKE